MRRFRVLSLQETRPAFWARLERAGGSERFPARVGEAGTALLSRFPLEAATDGAEARLRVPGAPAVWIKAVHPWPPVSAAAAPGWQDALAALPAADARGDVEILAGDFNATLDHAELRALLDRGWVDAADAVGEGLVWTWPALRRRALPLTIDHVLVDRRVRVARVHVVRMRRSDHRVVIAELRLPAAPAGVSRPGRGDPPPGRRGPVVSSTLSPGGILCGPARASNRPRVETGSTRRRAQDRRSNRLVRDVPVQLH